MLLTSLYSLAYSPVLSAGGLSPRNCSLLSTTNGLSLATQANASLGPEGVVQTVELIGRHWPSASPQVKRNAPQRPSPVRAAIIAAAAASPAPTPAATAVAPSATVAAAIASLSRRS